MKQIIIKDYFQQEMENLRRTVVNPPSLLIIDATDGDVGNQIYIKKKVKDFQSLGWKVEVASPEDDFSLVQLCKSDLYDGIICQMPISKKFNTDIKRIIPTTKDVDGLTIDPLVMPATVRGIIDYLNTCEFEYSGKTAVVLGRSEIVGKPMAKALLERDMTIVQCHSKTPWDTAKTMMCEADLIISAIGKPHFFSRRDIKPSAFVVDVGISRSHDNKITGDFEEIPYFCSPFGAASTPVPGGVGLLTRLGLIKNCVDLANPEGIYLGNQLPGQISIEECEQIMRITEDRN